MRVLTQRLLSQSLVISIYLITHPLTTDRISCFLAWQHLRFGTFEAEVHEDCLGVKEGAEDGGVKEDAQGLGLGDRAGREGH